MPAKFAVDGDIQIENGCLFIMSQSGQAANIVCINRSILQGTCEIGCKLHSIRQTGDYLIRQTTANLPGFYDPCVLEESCLRVLYRFHNTLHECTVADNESLRIPKQSHRLDPS
ncbi:uncharacterized protein LOC117102933 [Anneissia japonica]|uniref:uncharacterized protein LOC117102933 n=1 Tax=Anneissia japonica TaxID=1529436 RepID=UPI0014256E0C|nr:uncharacterized protein LOC117102933 [Anneissia japonica]